MTTAMTISMTSGNLPDDPQKIKSIFFKYGKAIVCLLLLFADVQPVIENGSTIVPFRALFETLGFKVTRVAGHSVQYKTSGEGNAALLTADVTLRPFTKNSTVTLMLNQL